MGVADVQDELVALLGGTIANAVDFERLLVAIGDAADHVVQQSAGQAVQGPLTVTRLPSATVTSTPAGMATGILPILLIVLYPPYHTNARTSPPM